MCSAAYWMTKVKEKVVASYACTRGFNKTTSLHSRHEPCPLTRSIFPLALGKIVRLLRDRADRLLASPEEPSRFARGVSAGAFAAMVPVFGLLIALAAAWLARGSRTTAAAACLLIGNPLTHAVTLPIAYELGHWMLPAAAVPGHIPPWLGTLLPIGEEALVGGALLGTVVAGFAYAVARCALRGRSTRR